MSPTIARALKPGDRLIWQTPTPKEVWYEPLYHLWKRAHGEEVVFVGYADKHDPLTLHTHDVHGLLILNVQTQVGVALFSSGYFQVIDPT